MFSVKRNELAAAATFALLGVPALEANGQTESAKNRPAATGNQNGAASKVASKKSATSDGLLNTSTASAFVIEGFDNINAQKAYQNALNNAKLDDQFTALAKAIEKGAQVKLKGDNRGNYQLVLNVDKQEIKVGKLRRRGSSDTFSDDVSTILKLANTAAIETEQSRGSGKPSMANRPQATTRSSDKSKESAAAGEAKSDKSYAIDSVATIINKSSVRDIKDYDEVKETAKYLSEVNSDRVRAGKQPLKVQIQTFNGGIAGVRKEGLFMLDVQDPNSESAGVVTSVKPIKYLLEEVRKAVDYLKQFETVQPK